MSSGGEGRFLDPNSGFMYPSHYELGPPPRLSKRAIRLRAEDDGPRFARLKRESEEAPGVHLLSRLSRRLNAVEK